MKNIISIDFEYRKTNQAKYELVACCFKVDDEKTRAFWLHNSPKALEKLKSSLIQYRDTHTFVAFNVVAEARSFISMNINPIKHKWIDIQAEYKMLLNYNDDFAYGSQLIDGKIVYTSRPNHYSDDDDSENHTQPQKSLAACTYKLLGVDINLKNKKDMVGLILHNETFSLEEKKDIINYCASDISYLPKLLEKIIQFYKRENIYSLKEMLWRGETVARIALLEAIGYPVNKIAIEKFTKSVPDILKSMQEDINSQFEKSIFKWDKRLQRYSIVQKTQQDWIASSEYNEKWPRTPNGKYSLSLDAFEKFFSYRHDYPKKNLPAQIIRFQRLKQSLNGFLPRTVNSKTQSFFDSLDDHGRVHPYLNPYGSSTSRYQPKATSFIMLKAAWMRALVEPKKGYAIAGIDYKSQEFLIAGLLSNDANMIKAYESGDVYFYFAKLAGAVPRDAVREQYELVRERFKSTTLGIQYGMGEVSLAQKLTNDTGVFHSVQDARDLIYQFEDAFSTYIDWLNEIDFDYRSDNYLKLVDGWYMFGDNQNERSVKNFMVQGTGACILRKAIQLCQDAGLRVIIPLHDALYIEYKIKDQYDVLPKFISCMRQAFIETISHEMSNLIKIDVTAWGKCYKENEIVEIEENKTKYKIKTKQIYIDGRAINDFEKFRPYFL